MPHPNPTAPSGAPADLAAPLPLAHAAAHELATAHELAADGLPEAHERPGDVTRRTVTWGGTLPGLDESLTDAVAEAFGIVLRHSPGEADPLDHPAFATLYAAARAEQVVLELSSRTNLVLAGTTAAIIGDGPIADRLTAMLNRIGVRVVRRTDDPLVALRAHLAGLATAPLPRSTRNADARGNLTRTATAPPVLGASTPQTHRADPRERPTAAATPHAAPGDDGSTQAACAPHYTFLTGENTAPLEAAHLAGILVDASPDGSALTVADAATPAPRPHVHLDGAARVVEIPAPLPHGAGSGLQWRIADALIALSILTARGDADDALARLALEVGA